MNKVTRLITFLFRLVGVGLYRLPKKRSINIGDLNFSGNVNWLRIPVYVSIMNTLRDNLEGLSVLEVGGSEGTLKRELLKKGVKYTESPPYPKCDITGGMPYNDESFDLIILDHILEHIPKPWNAVSEIYRLLKPHGIVICTTDFMYPYHGGQEWGDYYRFSPDGLRSLFKDKFTIIQADGWGNSSIIRLAYDFTERGLDGPAPIPKDEVCNIKNDSMNYIMTWVIAQK